jgi:hypothetical protein
MTWVNLPHKDYALPVPDLSPREDDPEQVARGRAWRRRSSYADYWELCVAGSWADVVAAYEASPDDVHDAYYYLDIHPAFWRFREPPLLSGLPQDHVSLLDHGYAFYHGAVEITPHKVNPATGCQDDDGGLNTRLEWWYEFGPRDLLPRSEDSGPVQATWHDYLLDGGAATYEQAVIDIALKVWTHYGNDRTVVDTSEWRNGDRAYRPEGDDEEADG